jgi:hypothetical protein
MLCNTLIHAQLNDKLTINAKPRRSEREMNNLLGKVKSFREEFFVSDKEVGFKRYYSYFSDEFQLFNENGAAISKKYFDKDGKVIYRKTIEYDSNGKINHVTEFDTTNNMTTKLAYVYNPLGQLSETVSEDNNTKPITSKFTYSSITNLPSKEEFRKEGILLKVTHYMYDATLNKTVIDSSYGANGKPYKSKLERYDASDNMLEQTLFDEKADIVLKYEYTFDKNNNNVEFKSYGQGGVLEGDFMYKFDEKNNMVEESKFYAYKNAKDSLVYEYKYDSVGNWIEKITKHHNIPKNIVKRNIQYHP